MEEGEDRLSELPDSLIVYILSLIKYEPSHFNIYKARSTATKDVVRTCVLSKRWQFLWKSMLQIDLEESSNDMEKINHFVSWVGSMFDECGVNHLHRFSVGFSYKERFAPNLKSWLQIAVERNVKDISLKCFGPIRRSYELPQILYSHSSLTDLSVSCWPLNPKETINWQSLKSLSIDRVRLSDCILEKVVSGCPVIEALRLRQCSGFTCLNISSTTFAKLGIEIRTNTTPTIDISAPHARELKIKYAGELKDRYSAYYIITQLRLRDISSLVRASLDFYKNATSPITHVYMVKLLESLQYVKELDLSDGCIEYMYNSLSHVAGLNIPPSKRRRITLDVGYRGSFHGILFILKSLPYLETLIIKGSHFDDPKDEIPEQAIKYLENNDLVFNHLKTINIALPRGSEVMALAKILIKSANVLQKMNLSYEPFDWEVSKELTKAMIALPRSSPEAIVAVEYIPFW